MSILNEFKTFAMRGNVVDLAVGVVVGGAFGKIVTSLVNDMIMPPLGLLINDVDFSKLTLTLKAASVNAKGEVIPAVTLSYGNFINTITQFIIVSFAIFMMVRLLNRLEHREVNKPAVTPEDVLLLREIRDELKKRPTTPQE